MNIKGAIFDMDGTLVDSLMYWDHLWRTVGRTFLGDEHFRPSEEDDKAVRTMLFRDAMEMIRVKYCFPLPKDGLWEFAVQDEERFYREDVFPKSGARELLEHLKAENVRMCVASATDRKYLPIALEHCGLEGYFEFLLSCEELGVGKDRPDVYHLALRRLGLEPQEVCVFEDSYVALETAGSIGCHTAGIYDKYNFGQERLLAASELYVGMGESLEVLIPKVGG